MQTDYVREDLTALGLTASWFREARDWDRPWRGKVQELLGHTQQSVGTVYMNCLID